MGSKASHRTMLFWFSHHQSFILYFIMFVGNHGVESASNDLVPSGKCSFYFWNQFRISVYSNLQKSPPWSLKSPPKSGKLQIARRGRFRPRWRLLVYIHQKRKKYTSAMVATMTSCSTAKLAAKSILQIVLRIIEIFTSICARRFYEQMVALIQPA